MNNHKTNITDLMVQSLWFNWAVAFGSIALVLVLPRLITHTWLPLAAFVLAYAVQVYKNNRDMGMMLNNVASLKVASSTLYLSAFVMGAIILAQRFELADEVFHWDGGNPEFPYITGLVVFPVMALCSIWSMATGYGQNLSGEYRYREGMTTGASVISSFLTRANHYQVTVMMLVSVGMTAVDLWYYYCYYINVNMNTPDIFFFNWMPALLFVASLYFMWVRYHSIGLILGPIVGANAKAGALVRYLVVSGDRMLLAPNDNGRWDTPASTHVELAKVHDTDEIRRLCADLLHTDSFTMKYLYESGANDLSCMQLHYAAFMTDESKAGDVRGDKGCWYTLDEIDRMLRKAELSAEFTDELYRLFTITMAWKTYDKEGRRLYPIKNYKPTFRIRDMKNWDVDYDDPVWMMVSRNNQDRPFFRTRRLWQKITGVRLR